MIRTTPFHERLAELNTSQLWSHWAGYLSAERYGTSAKHEYFAIRNSAGYFDTSPLYKYWIRGKESESFLAGVLARDIRKCDVGSGQYTIWCDERGFVIEDGVILRFADDEFLLSSAEPNLAYFENLIGGRHVEITEVTDDYGTLAVQGPRSTDILTSICPDAADLDFFACCRTKVAGVDALVSRTGFTGDLGYEIWVETAGAINMLDAVIAAAAPYGARPFGQQALLMSRIEAGLILINVEFESSRFAFTDHDRTTPIELGLGWMVRDVDDDRAFIGRDAIRAERQQNTSRWKTVGIVVDWQDYDRIFKEAGLIPPKDENPVTSEMMLYDSSGNRAGYATSFMYSPILQRHIAMARVHPKHGASGTTLSLEITVNHQYQTVLADIARPPLFNPSRKTAMI